MDNLFNQKIETLDRGHLQDIQLKNFKKTVKNVYQNNRFYTIYKLLGALLPLTTEFIGSIIILYMNVEKK